MAVDDKLRDDAVRGVALECIWRVGLRSCSLFLRDREPLRRVDDAVRRGLRVGDESRDVMGEWVTDVFAEDCWDVL